MKLGEFWLWSFDPELSLESEIRCPECGVWTFYEEWAQTEVGCEDCGSHDALKCPKCGECFDHVSSATFETRQTLP